MHRRKNPHQVRVESGEKCQPVLLDKQGRRDLVAQGLKGRAWQLVDGDCSSVTKCSEGGFPTLAACIEDAIQHGYVVHEGPNAFQQQDGRR